MTFKSSKSQSVQLITAGFIAVIVVCIVSLYFRAFDENPIVTVSASALMLAFLGILYATSLKEVRLDDDFLELKKAVGAIVVLLSDISHVSAVEPAGMAMTSSTKGVFGYIGKTMDDHLCMVNDKEKMIRIETADNKYLFSADDRDQLIAEICKRIQ